MLTEGSSEMRLVDIGECACDPPAPDSELTDLLAAEAAYPPSMICARACSLAKCYEPPRCALQMHESRSASWLQLQRQERHRGASSAQALAPKPA